MMPEAFGKPIVQYNLFTFEELVRDLRERGPALVEMQNLHSDFLLDGKLAYAGGPPEGAEQLESGHAMLLIGVHNDTNTHPKLHQPDAEFKFAPEDNLATPPTRIHLLLQNWWPEKPILKVRLDYFRRCGGRIVFAGNGEKTAKATVDSYSTKTNGIRRAVTSPAMEKGFKRRGCKSSN